VSPLRRVLVVLGLLILLASLCLLVVANLPNQHLRDRQPVSPEQLSLPTPEAFLILPGDPLCPPPAVPASPCRTALIA
jgi:hypothetical protein